MNLIPAFSLILLASVAGGLFPIPLRLRKVYSIEQMWGVAFLLGYGVLPTLLVLMFLPEPFSLILKADKGLLLTAFLYGTVWGIASICFAHAIAQIGLSLGYSIIMGLNTAVGTLLPLFRQWSQVQLQSIPWILAGVTSCLLSVIFCGWAGSERERAKGLSSRPSHSLIWGVFLCIFSGIMSAGSNLGFDYAAAVATPFLEQGIHPVWAGVARWIPVFYGAMAVVAGWSAFVIVRSCHVARFFARGSGHDFSWALSMGVALMLVQIPYGMGTHYLGTLGTSVGWAVFMGLSLLVANLTGILRGEWKNSSRKTGGILAGGFFFILLAILCLGMGNAVSH